jgi:hypothetical protein
MYLQKFARMKRRQITRGETLYCTYNEQKKIDLLALVFNGVYSYCIRKKNVRTAFQGSNGNYSCPCIYYIAAAPGCNSRRGGGGDSVILAAECDPPVPLLYTPSGVYYKTLVSCPGDVLALFARV